MGAMLSCIFGEKPYLKQCGSWFNMILVILLLPLLLVVAALALVLILAMMLIFLPIFLVFLLPCVIMKNCKEKIEDKRLEDFQGDLEMNHSRPTDLIIIRVTKAFKMTLVMTY